MKKILFLNLYGMRNIGDMAIRNAGLTIVEEALGVNKFFLLCESKIDFPIQANIKSYVNIEYAPYGYAIKSKNKPASLFIKSIRLLVIITKSLFYTFLGLINNNLLPKKGFYKYIRLIKESELVIAMGGGYFITSDSVKDFFGICLNALPIYIAKFFRKKVIVLPSSFGPFASNIHEMIAGYAIKNTLFMAREEISLEYVKKYCINAKNIPDLALYDWKGIKNRRKKDYFVLTLRQGLGMSQNKQDTIEQDIAKCVIEVWKKYKLPCIFIPMASNLIEENDLIVAKRLEKLINNSQIFSIKFPKNPVEAKKILRNAKLSVCNRLHSAILSATEYTPFITISYAHKTIGFMKFFGLDEWNINMSEVNYKILMNKLDKIFIESNHKKVVGVLNNNYKKISKYRHVMINEIRNTQN